MKTFLRTSVVLSAFISTFVWTISSHRQIPVVEQYAKNSEHRSEALEALDFWTRSRAYPGNDIPKNKYYNAVQSSRAHIKNFRRSADALNSWQFMGPSNLSGRTISLAVNPQDPNTIYAGSASGGLWRSRTGGVSGDWQRMTIGFPVLGVGAIAITPNDSNTMYIGTGEVYGYGNAFGGLVVRTTRGSYGLGIFKSTNAGATWTSSLNKTNDEQTGVQAIKINPLNPHTIWAAVTDGIYKSTDAGLSWNIMLATPMAEDIVINSIDTNRVLCSAGNFGAGPAIYLTTDGGTNWQDVKPITFSGKTLLAPYPPNPNDVYASINDYNTDTSANPGSIWKSTDFGGSWTQINSSSDLGVQGWYSHFIAIHPLDSLQIVWANVGAAKSTNGGTSFSNSVFSGPVTVADNHAYAIDPVNPNILYECADQGVFRSTNFGASFSYVSNNLNTGQFYNGFSNSASDSNLAIVQSQDHLPLYVYHGSLTWGTGIGDEAGWTAIDQSNDNFLYDISRNGEGVTRSTNRGVSWASGGFFGGFGAWNSPLVVSKSSPNILYVGKDKIYKSGTNGTAWSPVNGNALIDGGNPALCMALSATSPDTLIVGTAPYVANAHIFRSTNGGISFVDVTGSLPDRYPTDVAIDPNNSQIMYAVFSGFGAGHIFRSTNAGGSWTDITGTLPDVPTQAIFIDPQHSNYLYVGNDIGVFISTDNGANWQSFGDGLPEGVLVSDLSYSPSNRMLRASTHGNGAYQRKLPAAFPSLTLQSPNGGESWNGGSVHSITWLSDFVPMVNLDYSTDNGTTWYPIAHNISASLPGYNWIAPTANTSSALVRVVSASDTTLGDQSNNVFAITLVGSLVSIQGHWNMLSVPRLVSDARKTSLFPTAVSNAYTYTGTYIVKDTLLHGVGYWIDFNADQDLAIDGNPITNDTIGIIVGWNMIGSITSALAVESIGSIPGGIITSEFFGYNGGYFVTDSIRPGFGYWIHASQAGQIILSSSSIAPSSRIRITPTGELPPAAPPDVISNLALSEPKNFELLQNYPNPFNPTTTVSFVIGHSSFVHVGIFDLLGREVATLVNEQKGNGEYHVAWDASNFPSGMYVYKLTAGNFVQSKKMLLMK